MSILDQNAIKNNVKKNADLEKRYIPNGEGMGNYLTRGMQSRQMAARLPNLCTRLTLFFNKTLKSTRLTLFSRSWLTVM